MRILIVVVLFTGVVFGKGFVLKSIDDRPYHFEITPLELKVQEFGNRIIILDFFGANCTPCIAEMPELVQFQKDFNQTVQIIGIQSGSKRDNTAMRQFVKKHSLNYPVINLEEAVELIRYVQESIGWNGALPFKLLYDFDGSALYSVYGMVSEQKLLNLLKSR
jgi:thiol-disulfide isomerase/thioredoxin